MIFLASLDKALIAYIDKNDRRFEIYVDPDESLKYRTGETTSIRKTLITDDIYKDIKKGERHTSNTLEDTFGTADPLEVAKIILDKGHVPFTTQQKRKLREQKLKKIINIIVREAIDPRTKAPHTKVRVENAMDKLKIHVDPFKSAESQVEDVVEKLRIELPISFEKLKIAVKVPAEYSQKIYGTLKEYNMENEQWTNKGELVGLIRIPAGLQGEFYDRINKLTHGNIETRVIKK